ncbi:MAG: RNA-binding cell elongation regulator Jag/EloR [Lachnospiraceae bacterium]|nr:RNA-binding cell elongation regulator Jag/EloR [Lachnospiraceae bacterium]
MEFQLFTGKNVEDALTKALVELGVTSDKVEYEVVDKGSNGILGIGSKPAKINVKIKEEKPIVVEEAPADIEAVIVEFLSKVFDAMNLTVKINVNITEESVDVDLVGDDMGVLIGKRGQTLDSLQYLVSLVVNKKSDKYLRVKLDTENYRERRKETLENLAKNIAFKVKRTKRSVSLEPMNPYERRVIHSALQNDKYVTTKSEGEEPFRHVVVMLKK